MVRLPQAAARAVSGRWRVECCTRLTHDGTHDDTRTQHTRRSRVRSGAGEDESEEPKRIMDMVLAARRPEMFMPIAFTTYGGMGDEFLKKRWRPFYKELMAEELKAGGKGWKTRKRQQRALEKLSIVLARENGAMIARATSWQQAVATRP